MAKRNMPPKNIPVLQKVMPKTEPEPPVVSNEPIELVVSNCAMLNVRARPDKGSPVLFTIAEGTVVLVDDMVANWFHIHVLNNETKKGYALAQYLKEI